MGGQHHARPLYPGKRPGTPFIGDWVGPRAGLDECGKSCPHRHSIPGAHPVASRYTDCSIPIHQWVQKKCKFTCISVIKLNFQWLLHAWPSFRLTDSTFCPNNAFTCSKENGTIALSRTERLVILMQARCVYCAVRTASLIKMHIKFSVQKYYHFRLYDTILFGQYDYPWIYSLLYQKVPLIVKGKLKILTL